MFFFFSTVPPQRLIITKTLRNFKSTTIDKFHRRRSHHHSRRRRYCIFKSSIYTTTTTSTTRQCILSALMLTSTAIQLFVRLDDCKGIRFFMFLHLRRCLRRDNSVTVVQVYRNYVVHLSDERLKVSPIGLIIIFLGFADRRGDDHLLLSSEVSQTRDKNILQTTVYCPSAANVFGF